MGGRGECKPEKRREKAVHQYSFMQNMHLSSRNRDGDERCIYLSFTSWYANIMRSAHQITQSLHEY